MLCRVTVRVFLNLVAQAGRVSFALCRLCYIEQLNRLAADPFEQSPTHRVHVCVIVGKHFLWLIRVTCLWLWRWEYHVLASAIKSTSQSSSRRQHGTLFKSGHLSVRACAVEENYCRGYRRPPSYTAATAGNHSKLAELVYMIQIHQQSIDTLSRQELVDKWG